MINLKGSEICEIRKQMVLHEGEDLDLYKCTKGKLTIGIGRNIEDNGISEDESQLMFSNDLKRVLNECERHFKWFKSLSWVRKRVLIDMNFNLGITKLLKFPLFLKACSLGDWDKAAYEMEDSDWWDQVGTRARRLKHYMLTNNTDFQEVKK